LGKGRNAAGSGEAAGWYNSAMAFSRPQFRLLTIFALIALVGWGMVAIPYWWRCYHDYQTVKMEGELYGLLEVRVTLPKSYSDQETHAMASEVHSRIHTLQRQIRERKLSSGVDPAEL
jgi:hypothetical protein